MIEKVHAPLLYQCTHLRIDHPLNMKAKNWVDSTQPFTPSFLVLYLKTQRGREPQLVWAGTQLFFYWRSRKERGFIMIFCLGPEHMAEFVDEEVRQKF